MAVKTPLHLLRQPPVVCTVLLSCLPVSAQVLDMNGQASDFSQSFYMAQSIQVKWNFPNQSVDSLWVTSWYYKDYPYSQLLAENIRLVSPGQYNWTISIPSYQLSEVQQYVLQLKPATLPSIYDPGTANFSSLGFQVLPWSTPLFTPTQTPIRPRRLSTLNTSQQVGLVIGLAFAVLILLEIVYWYMLHKRTNRNLSDSGHVNVPEVKPEVPHELLDQRKDRSELSDQHGRPGELDGYPLSNITNSSVIEPIELAT